MSADWYRDHNVELLLGTTATRVDPTVHTVELDSGTSLSYDGLLLATGSDPRQLGIPGADLEGVHYLRTLDDAEVLHGLLVSGGRRVVVIGSGWIGMEVAATATTLGNEVSSVRHGVRAESHPARPHV